MSQTPPPPKSNRADVSKLIVLMITAFVDMVGVLMIIPLTPFYDKAPGTHYLRLCFAKSDATMEAAAERLCKL